MLDPSTSSKLSRMMRVEVIQDQVHLAHLSIAAAQQAADEGDKVHLGAPGGDLHEATLTARFDGDEEIAGSGPLVLVVLLGHHSRLGRQGAHASRAAVVCIFSSRQITGSRGSCGRAYRSSSSYMRQRYSSVSSPMHHISFRQGLRRFFLESPVGDP